MSQSATQTNATLWWVRRDFRLGDNPALTACGQSGHPVLPVFIHSSSQDHEEEWPTGSAARVWLADALARLDESLTTLHSRLTIRQGETLQTLIMLCRETNSREIHANARYEPWARRQQETLATALAQEGIRLVVHPGGCLLFEPDEILSGSGGPYQVFTPYYKKCRQHWKEFTPLSAPRKLKAPTQWPSSLHIEELGLRPAIPWDQGIRETWQPGTTAAHKRLREFITHHLFDYPTARDIPSVDGTSRMSPYLHFGEVTPRQILQALDELEARRAEPFIRELVWREFAHQILWHFPHTTTAPLKAKFNGLSWHQQPEALAQWQRGMTGYPIVDAGMRQLWQTGWMHNRVRMIVGSFLVKDLLIDWREGAAWFWDTLVDADLANNSLNWQWVAGCGADAQPFFRIFNPISQGQKFDPQGTYVRQWVPELVSLPDRYIHAPWLAKKEILQKAGITLGETYPRPMVHHAQARERALLAFRKITPKAASTKSTTTTKPV